MLVVMDVTLLHAATTLDDRKPALMQFEINVCM